MISTGLSEFSKYNFRSVLEKNNLKLKPVSVETLWINITRMCNQNCSHCHVNASPQRAECMDRRCIDKCLEILAKYSSVKTLDITGGAPELNPDFEYFVSQARNLGKKVKVRHNLTVTLDGNPCTGENKEFLPHFFSQNNVEIIASLPHYRQKITDGVRGNGVFKKSIEGLVRLNNLGYGKEGTGLILNLVYNADGPVTPFERTILENEYKSELYSNYSIAFNSLLCVTNMPINRYLNMLINQERYEKYMDRLVSAFDIQASRELVCRSLVSVGYDGKIYDCDFNQMLNLQIVHRTGMTVYNFNLEALLNREILFGSHCFGCTAGGGSS